MKIIAVFPLVTAALASLVEKRECAGNDCRRQVTGTRAGLLAITSRQADCSSFMATTIIPDATTTTVTVTVNHGKGGFTRTRRNLKARATTQVPSSIPPYASSCTRAADYSAACSCWGITARVTTAARPTSTKTVTVTHRYCEES